MWSSVSYDWTLGVVGLNHTEVSSGCWVRCSLPQPFSAEISFRKNIQPTFSAVKTNGVCASEALVSCTKLHDVTTEECVANYLKSWRSSRKCINFQFLRCRSVTASYVGRSDWSHRSCVYTYDVRLFHTSSGMTWRHRNWLLCSFKRSRITASGTFCFIAASSFEAGGYTCVTCLETAGAPILRRLISCIKFYGL